MTKRLWAALVAVLCMSSCEDSVLDPTTEVTGIVVDHITNEPLSGVTVTLSENDDVWLGGARILQEQQTAADGKFAFKFEWKESPYKIRVKKPDYTYTHLAYNERFKELPPVVTDYQNLESLKKKHDLVFDMEPAGNIILNVINSQPQSGNSRLTLKLENMSKSLHSLGFQTFEGTGLTDYHIMATANKYTRYTYTIEKDGTSQTRVDSVFVNHITPTPLTITY